MSKCCYIHFRPNKHTDENSPTNYLSLDGVPIKKTSTAKFLGVTIDDKLSWEPHVTALRQKLGYASATLNKIRDSVPAELHSDLYHTLFESHLTYCISVWGGAPGCITDRIFTSQKHCMRILFGDKQEFLDRYKTCARTRPLTKQTLSTDFFEKEHTKPLFTKHNIMAFKNLYTYHTFMEVFKILKLRTPLSLSDYFTKSSRKETTLITAFPTDDFISRSTKIWNDIAPKLKLVDYSHKISAAKSSLKKTLLVNQSSGDTLFWNANNFGI